MAAPGISYRVSLVVAIPLLIVIAGALIAGNSYVATRDGIDALTAQLFDQVSELAAQETRAHLRQAEPAVDLLVASIGAMAPRDDISQDDELAAELVDVLRASSGFEWVSFGDEHGSVLSAHRRGGEVRLKRSRRSEGGADVSYEIVAASGEHGPVERSRSDYDPRTRPYYALARAARRRVWTEPYVFFDQHAPGITCAAPVYASDGSLRGVVTVDFGLAVLSEFVRTLRLSPHAVAFLYTGRDGAILAHPTLAAASELRSGELVTVANVDDPLVRAFFAARDTQRSEGRFRFGLGGGSWIGQTRAFPIDRELAWHVAVAAPEADFSGPLDRIARVAAAVSIAAVLLAVALGAALARTVARPLARIAGEMERVGRFEIAASDPRSSIFREINAMDQALGAMKGGLKSFGAYVPRDLVRAVLATGARAELGGTTKELTILFADLAGFTTLAESMRPDALVELLGGYFDEMTKVVEAHGGTIDKFIGDAIMAFWNAPGDVPEHAARACAAALECQARLDAMRARDPRLAGIRARIGLATGEVLVGNIGSSDRMNYTVMGDAVNLAARLEGLNKSYGTRVMISEVTWEAAKHAVVARPIDVVAVQGKARGVRVYEPIAPAADARPEDVELAEACTRALDAYLARDFAGAARAWDAALALRPEDKACAAMKERALAYDASPPSTEWAGAHVMKEK